MSNAYDWCTVTASTKRNEDLGSGRTGAAVENLSALRVTPLWPVSPQTQRELDLNSPREYKECYHVPAAQGGTLPDVLEGDVLVVGSDEYQVFSVAEWLGIDANDYPSLHLVVQEVKGS